MREPLREEHELSTADLARSGAAADGTRGVATSTADMARRADAAADAGDRAGGAEDRAAPLFAADEAERFRSEWTRIQADFVDEPAPSVEHADALVASVMKRLAEIFAEERSRLESEWHRGGDVSTEDLRLALQRYRSFFTRLLSV
jgi:hypothetical protein